MSRYSLTHLSDGTLLQNLHLLHRREDANTADILAHIAEVDERKLFAPAGYPSMSAYCVGELHRSEDAAAKRLQAARTARKFPVILELVADGRLHLSGICLLAPCLTEANAHELIAAAVHRTKSQIESLLAERFPKPDVSERVQAITTSYAVAQHAPGHVEPEGRPPAPHAETELQLLAGPEDGSVPYDRMSPLGAERFAIQATIGQEAHDDLRHARALLGQQGGELGAVLGLAFRALVEKLEKRKFAATARPRSAGQSSSNDPRQIPASVRRAVVERDGGQCRFASDGGRRCEARSHLEFDHIEPVAKGGQSTVENLRLLCRAHNQYEAERAFGPQFIKEKREKAKSEKPRAAEPPKPFDGDVVRCLQRLGLGAKEAQEAAANSGASPDERLEERVRAALQWFGGGRRKVESEARPVAKTG